MKILLITAFNGIHPRTIFPLGLGYLASSLRAKGYQADILDLSIYNNDPEILSEKLLSYSPDVIGLSIRDVDSSGRDILRDRPEEFFLPEYRQLINRCKKWNCPIVLGGSGFSLFPEEILRYFSLPLGITGEGEKTFCDLIFRLEENRSLNNLRGIIVLQKNKVYFNSRKHIHNLDVLPFPIRNILGSDGHLIGNIQTKRGCNLSCIYCCYPVVDGRKIRLRSPKSVVDEFEIMVKSLGYKYVFIVDNVFNNPMNHAYEICEELIRRRIKVRWGCNANPGFINEKLLNMMVKAGCYDVIFGTDSLSKKMLEILGKNFDIGLIKKINKLAIKNNLTFVHSLVLGGPGENENTVRETLSNVEELNPPLGIGISHGLRIYPCTKLEHIAVKERYLPPRYSLLKPCYYVSLQIKEKLEEYANKFVPFLFKTKSHFLLLDELERKYPYLRGQITP